MGGILCSEVDSVRTMTARISIAEHRAVQCQTGSAPPPLARLFIPGVEALPFPPLEKNYLLLRAGSQDVPLEKRRLWRGASTVRSTSKVRASWDMLWLQELQISPHGYISRNANHVRSHCLYSTCPGLCRGCPHIDTVSLRQFPWPMAGCIEKKKPLVLSLHSKLFSGRK